MKIEQHTMSGFSGNVAPVRRSVSGGGVGRVCASSCTLLHDIVMHINQPGYSI